MLTDHQTDPREFLDVVFDGPPSHESGRFVEVEDKNGKSVKVGRWIDRGDGYWTLRIPTLADAQDEATVETVALALYCAMARPVLEKYAVEAWSVDTDKVRDRYRRWARAVLVVLWQ
jgi:hypothetical protein